MLIASLLHKLADQSDSRIVRQKTTRAEIQLYNNGAATKKILSETLSYTAGNNIGGPVLVTTWKAVHRPLGQGRAVVSCMEALREAASNCMTPNMEGSGQSETPSSQEKPYIAMPNNTLLGTMMSTRTVLLAIASGKTIPSDPVLDNTTTTESIPMVIGPKTLETLQAFFQQTHHPQVKFPILPW